MKGFITLLIPLYLISCATKPTVSQSAYNEYEIVRLALEQYKTIKFEEFRLIKNPENGSIVDFFNGIHYGFIELSGTFSFSENHVTAWNEKLLIGVDRKVVIIEDFKKIPKAPLHESEKSQIYFSLSNPIFSNDGQYALINVNSFFNHELSPAESKILVFKLVEEKWEYQYNFTNILY